MSEVVSVRLPAVLRVTLKFCVPATSAALLGSTALLSLEVMPTRSLVMIKFQLASTALTVTLKAVPAVRAVGVPLLPAALPGAAVSPGTNSCSFTNAPALTVMEELVLAVLVPSVMSVAVTVRVPEVLHVTLKVCVPPESAALAGRKAFESEEVIPTVSLTLVTKFQLASTALTVTLKALPAAWAVGVPVLPVALPGEAVSPGVRTCSLAKAPGLTVMAGLVLLAIPVCVTSEAVTVQLPAVLLVRLKLFVPETRAALAGRMPLGSVPVIPTVSLVLTKFQLA